MGMRGGAIPVPHLLLLRRPPAAYRPLVGLISELNALSLGRLMARSHQLELSLRPATSDEA